MSSLWTPSGEHFPKKEGDDAASPPHDGEGDTDVTQTPGAAPLTDEQAAAQAEVDAMRAQLAHTPAEVVVANHCYGLFELAAIYLSQSPPMLFQARLAIDGLGSLLDGLRGRLGERLDAELDTVGVHEPDFTGTDSVVDPVLCCGFSDDASSHLSLGRAVLPRANRWRRGRRAGRARVRGTFDLAHGAPRGAGWWPGGGHSVVAPLPCSQGA